MQKYGLDFLAPTDLSFQTEVGTIAFRKVTFLLRRKKTPKTTTKPTQNSYLLKHAFSFPLKKKG